jgi:hypothetical protein
MGHVRSTSSGESTGKQLRASPPVTVAQRHNRRAPRVVNYARAVHEDKRIVLVIIITCHHVTLNVRNALQRVTEGGGSTWRVGPGRWPGVAAVGGRRLDAGPCGREVWSSVPYAISGYHESSS